MDYWTFYTRRAGSSVARFTREAAIAIDGLASLLTDVGVAVVLVRGLPGAGKTTLGRLICAKLPGFRHIEADDFFTDDQGIYRFDPSLLGAAHARSHRIAAQSLAENRSVLMSNTLTTWQEISPLWNLARAANTAFVCVECRGEYRNCHNVPLSALEKMRRRYQPLDVVRRRCEEQSVARGARPLSSHIAQLRHAAVAAIPDLPGFRGPTETPHNPRKRRVAQCRNN
jgi:hypothetical protein